MLFDHRHHFGIRNRIALARYIVVPACAGLLAEAALFTQQVSRLAVLHVRLFLVATLANRPADVVTGQIAHTEGAHRHTEFLHGLVDLRGGAAFVQQETTLAAVLLDHAVADKAIAHARHHSRLLYLLGHAHHGSHHVLGGLGATHHFQQLHHIGWAEEVQAHHVFGALREGCNFVNVQGRGVGSQDGAGLHHTVQLLEYGFFDADFFKHSFDHQIGTSQVVVAQGGRQQRHALVVLVLLELAFLDLRFVVLADDGDATVQRVLLHLQHLDRNTSVQEVHRNAATHGASANNGDRVDCAQRGVRWHIGNLGGRALRQEQMAQTAALSSPHQVDEDVALDSHTCVKLLFGGGFHSVDALGGRREVFAHTLHHISGKRKVRITQWVLAGQVAHQWQWAGVCHRAGKGNCLFHHALSRRGHLVEQLLARGHRQHVALHGFAADDHVQSGLYTQHAWQALRAASAGQQAQLHFRQGYAGARGYYAVVATQCQLQTAAHHHGVDSSNNGFAGSFQHTDHAIQARLLHGSGFTKFFDIRATRKSLASARNDDGLNSRVGIGLGHTGSDALAGGQPQAVNRRVV